MFHINRDDLLTVIHIVSNMLRMYGLTLVIPLIVSLIYSETLYALVFFLMAVIFTASFWAIQSLVPAKVCDTKHAVLSLAVIWIMIALVSVIPFIVYGMPFVDAFFESTSGWSGTGLTMIQDPSILPHSISFFRGFIQWVGGFGMVILVLLLYEKPKTAYALFLAEGRFEDFCLDFVKIARIVVGIYVSYTILGIFFMWISGVPFFDAAVHILSIIATGGFSTNSVGIGWFGKWPMFVAIIWMYIGGTSFLSHYSLISGRVRKFFRNPELRYMFAIFVVCSAIIGLDLYLSHKAVYYHGVFYVLSAMTGTGAGTPFAVSDFPPASIIILTLLMISGPAYGSTGGAVKLWRSIIVISVIRREIKKPFMHPNAVMPIKMGNNLIDEETASKVASFVLVYIFLILLGGIVFMFFNYGLVDSIFTVASAQGNVGLSTISGDIWFGMPYILKILLVIHMLIGRVEIFPFFVLLKALAGREDLKVLGGRE